MSEQGEVQTDPSYRVVRGLALIERLEQLVPEFLRYQRKALELFALFDEAKAALQQLEGAIVERTQALDEVAAKFSAMQTRVVALEPEVAKAEHLAGQIDELESKRDALVARLTAA